MKFIVCSDLHLRPDVPRARVQSQEEWVETQKSQLQFIADKAKEFNCPVVICGDIFHTSQVPDYIKNMFMTSFSENKIYAIAGQHDLYYRSMENMDKTSFGTLYFSGYIQDPFGKFAHYGQETKIVQDPDNLLFLHTLIFEDQKSIPPNTKAMTAKEALDKYPDAKWIFAGDQHRGFAKGISDTVTKRYVIVPGAINTQSSDQNYKHSIWYVDTDKEEIEQIEIPGDGVEIVTDAYVQESKDKMDRIHSFATLIKEKMQQGKGSGIDFKENVRKSMENNDELTPGAIKIINQVMEK